MKKNIDEYRTDNELKELVADALPLRELPDSLTYDAVVEKISSVKVKKIPVRKYAAVAAAFAVCVLFVVMFEGIGVGKKESDLYTMASDSSNDAFEYSGEDAFLEKEDREYVASEVCPNECCKSGNWLGADRESLSLCLEGIIYTGSFSESVNYNIVNRLLYCGDEITNCIFDVLLYTNKRNPDCLCAVWSTDEGRKIVFMYRED